MALCCSSERASGVRHTSVKMEMSGQPSVSPMVFVQSDLPVGETDRIWALVPKLSSYLHLGTLYHISFTVNTTTKDTSRLDDLHAVYST